jgi:hypothetical protein
MSKERIVEIARQMLDGNIGIVDGCTAICKARTGLEIAQLQNAVLLPFISFESEMHNFPLGESRKSWSEQALRAKDTRLKEIITTAEPEILDACRTLLDHWS